MVRPEFGPGEQFYAAVQARLSLENQLRRALKRKEFTPYYQPKASLGTGESTGVEAQIRWHAPGRSLVPPDRFIRVLEDSGLILPVGAWAIRTACAQLAAWAQMGVCIAMDDFGIGHSSLCYLKRFDIDTLMIDRSFVSEPPHDAEDKVIATAIVAMGHSLHMRIVAEGVETLEQADSKPMQLMTMEMAGGDQ